MSQTIESEMIINGRKVKIFQIPEDQIDNFRNPAHPVGDNRPRSNSFTHHLNSKKGKVFQGVLKPALIMMINKMHSWVLKSWDPEGFIYDDPRMQYLDTTLHEFINENFADQQRKIDFMNKAVDIGLFLLKEDIYYRARLFKLLNKLPIFKLEIKESVNMAVFGKGKSNATLNEMIAIEQLLSAGEG